MSYTLNLQFIYLCYILYTSGGTHQPGFVGRLHLLPLNLVPVDVLEEGMDCDLTVWAEGDAQPAGAVLVQQLQHTPIISTESLSLSHMRKHTLLIH